MWLEAIITQEDFVQVLAEFLPVKIYLDAEEDDKETEKDRWLLLQPATAVALIPDEGLRATCSAELKWSIAGVSPTVKIDQLRILLRPQVVEKNKGYALEFTLEVEVADFHVLPAFVDATIVKAINASLASKKPTWNIAETLTRRVALGTMFNPVEALDIRVAWGKLRIGEEAFTLAVSFKIGFIRGD